MKSVIGLISLVCLSACGPSDQPAWFKGETAHVLIVEKDFTPSQIRNIKDAVYLWDKALNGYIHFEYVADDKHDNLIVVRGQTIQMIDERLPESEAYTIDEPWKDGGDVYLPINDDKTLFRFGPGVVEHEIGHAIGLNHRDGPVLMNPTMHRDSDVITCSDLQQFCDNNDCDYHDFPMCAEASK